MVMIVGEQTSPGLFLYKMRWENLSKRGPKRAIDLFFIFVFVFAFAFGWVGDITR